MIGRVGNRAILIDTSAAIALVDEKDQFHEQARGYFSGIAGASWAVLSLTQYEALGYPIDSSDHNM